MGHRTPQGLYVEGNSILAAEHGPRGGDEINNIKFNGNYGWPLVSYGEPYYFEEFYDKDISLKKFFYKKIIQAKILLNQYMLLFHQSELIR